MPSDSLYSARPVWAEINLDHLAHNIKQFKDLVGPETQIMAVVKADAYGHGAIEVSKVALEAGAASLAVAFLEEAVELRRANIKAPILLLGYTDPVYSTTLLDYKLTPTVFGFETASEFSARASELGVELPVHIKVDTGMGRIGLLPEEALEVVSRIVNLPNLKIEGLFTHFAAAEEINNSYTESQLNLFIRIHESCLEKGISFPMLHAANTAGAINYKGSHFNAIRLGIGMYGCYPDVGMESDNLQLYPALSLKSRVVLVKKVPPGTAISYGCTYRTAKESLIATIPIGYADGYSRLQSNRGHIIVRGERAKVAGRVCMDHLMADVSHIPGVRLGDEVVIYGRQGNREVKVEEAAGNAGTINYEILCAIGKRVPRLYFGDGLLASVHDFIEDRYVR